MAEDVISSFPMPLAAQVRGAERFSVWRRHKMASSCSACFMFLWRGGKNLRRRCDVFTARWTLWFLGVCWGIFPVQRDITLVLCFRLFLCEIRSRVRVFLKLPQQILTDFCPTWQQELEAFNWWNKIWENSTRFFVICVYETEEKNPNKQTTNLFPFTRLLTVWNGNYGQ